MKGTGFAFYWKMQEIANKDKGLGLGLGLGLGSENFLPERFFPGNNISTFSSNFVSLKQQKLQTVFK